MQIAVTSQNRKTITQHAGKCRKFWIYDIQEGRVAGKQLIELPMEQSFHASQHQLAEPLTKVNVLISASMGAGLYQRLKQSGIQPIITMEEDPDLAVNAFVGNNLDHLPVDREHHCSEHGHGHRHGHSH